MSEKKQGICDRCNGPLKKPQGYLVWNPVTDLTSEQPFGTMLLCYKCARKIFSSKAIYLSSFSWESTDIWKMNKTEFNKVLQMQMFSFLLINKKSDIFDPKGFSDIMEAQDKVHIVGIVQRLRNRGLDKKKAMKWARELGELWWSDPEKAEKAVSKKKWFSSWK